MEYRREAGENGGGKIQGLSARIPLERIEYVDPATRFVQPDGSLKTELSGGNYLHLNTDGYRVRCERIARLVPVRNVDFRKVKILTFRTSWVIIRFYVIFPLPYSKNKELWRDGRVLWWIIPPDIPGL